MKYAFIAITITSLLTGCAGLNSDFSCNETAGSSCMTVSEANQLGVISKNKIKTNNNQDRLVLDSSVEVNSNFNSNEINIPKRTSEDVLKIYIKSYVDEKDNLHKDQMIFFTVNDPTWKGYE